MVLSVNQAYYVEILKQLQEAACRKIPKLLPNDWILQHNNAPANMALSRSFWPKSDC
jgi:hypothetical protein